MTLLDDITATIRRYVHMPGTMADATALWIVHTWIHGHLEISTFLHVTSATRRCGKSLLMEIVAKLVCRPLELGGRVTPAAMFRVIERDQPTLLMDEADTYLSEDTELRGVINGSQRRSGAFVMRTVGEDHEPRRFRTWCAKMIGGIGELPDTVRDRSLVLRLKRRAPGVGDRQRWRDHNRQTIEDMNRKLIRWTDDNTDSILAGRSDVVYLSGLDDRARDAWEALLAIADCAGGEWAGENGRAWQAAAAVSANIDDETGAREMLLADIHTTFGRAGDREAMTTEDILRSLNEMEGRPWPEWRRGAPLTARGLAKLLKPFDIAPGTIRVDGIATAGGTAKGYKRSAFSDVWESYSIEVVRRRMI